MRNLMLINHILVFCGNKSYAGEAIDFDISDQDSGSFNQEISWLKRLLDFY